MSTTPIEGTAFTIATVNDDWASAGSNLGMVTDLRGVNGAKAKAPVVDCDVVMIQEGKRADYSTLVDSTRTVHQDTSTQAKAGSVLIWRTVSALKATKTGWTFLVLATGLLGRYLAWGAFDVVSGPATGRKLLLGSAHRPPHRAAKWWHPFDAALALRCRTAKKTGRLVIIGMDANQVNPETLAKMCGLVWHSTRGRSIDGWLASPQILFSDVTELPKATSDHHPLAVTVTIPKRKPKVKKVKNPPPFEHVIYNGKLMDNKTKLAVQAMEKRLGYPLTIVQGCYNVGGVSASAGTHDGGGVVDLAPFDFENKVRIGRKVGWFIWHRTAIPGVWGEHVHGGIRNHGRLSPAAQAQQRDYDGTPPRNGLATHAIDNTFHPNPPVTFHYPATTTVPAGKP